ncbi:MAG: hypothetical protein ACI9QA_000086 [Methanobacteriota archaeon]|jgi:hypothetical protein|uniref:Uncharacterized protein n=1 Tax=Halorutilus salinus TaxID=2487751 RepID=A0A9Q4GJK6_9EURY|nr:hypothetical protein [Halorutilus salinus]MCX2819321.1 hypothetical protein [Halorutilus salinus]
MSPNRRDGFDVLFAVYVAGVVAPAVGGYAGILAYLGGFVGVTLIAYTGASEAERLPQRVAQRPFSTGIVAVPLVYGVVYIVGEAVASTPIRSPYVYLGLWNVLVGIAVVAVARRTA